MGVTLPLVGVDRLRMESDGEGVTTLVAAKGCPLSCKYCINAHILKKEVPVKDVSPEELVDLVKIDDLYFQATGGGVVFGGGESLLHADFIAAFAKVMPEGWKITVETSLNVPAKAVRTVLPFVDYYIVDIKDTNPETYRNYTGKEGRQAYSNLRLLVKEGTEGKIKVRIPLIPGFNTEEECRKSVGVVREIGAFDKIEVFPYRIPDAEKGA